MIWKWLRGLMLLCLLPLGAGAPTRSVSAQDERADLKVELVGVPLTTGQRVITVRVTNISQWWADETNLVIRTVFPGAPNQKTFKVENLDPGQSVPFSYTIESDCNLHVIRAEVTPAKNYAGVPETNMGNNAIEDQVCGAPSSPSTTTGAVQTRRNTGPIVAPPGGVEVNRLPTDLIVAEHLKPGTHTLDFKPQSQLSVSSSRYYLTLPKETPEPVWIGWQPWSHHREVSPLTVGWAQNEDNWTHPRFRSHQVLMRFDLSLLDEVPRKIVSRATLTFDETPKEWLNEEGDSEGKPGCASTLGRLRFDTDFSSARGLIETEYVNDIPPGGQGTNALRQILGREVNVTQHVLGYVAYPDFFQYQPSFVLRPEIENGEADDNEACLSTITGLVLRVTYTVPN